MTWAFPKTTTICSWTTVEGRKVPSLALKGREMWRKRWLPLAAGIVLFAGSIAAYVWLYEGHPLRANPSDESVYYLAGRLIRSHPAALYNDMVGLTGNVKLPYTYTPFAALVFEAGTVFSWAVWKAGLIVVDLVLLPLIVVVSMRIKNRDLDIWQAAALALALAAVSLWLEPVFGTLSFGQINLVLLALIIGDLALPDSSRWKGIGIGIAGAIKLTPLIFIPYLLLTRRIRAGITSAVTFLATVGIGFVFLPTASRWYWGGSGLTASGSEIEEVLNQSLDGVIMRSITGHSAQHLLWLLLAAVVGISGLAIAAIAARRGEHLLGIFVCGVTGLLVSPISWTHHWVWVVPGLAFMLTGSRRSRPWRAAGAAALLGLFLMWPMNHHLVNLPTSGRAGLVRIGSEMAASSDRGHLLRNLYVVTGLAVLVLAAVYLWLSSRAKEVDGTSAPSIGADVPSTS
jgi:alpha-1,2-mannosyltransferase